MHKEEKPTHDHVVEGFPSFAFRSYYKDSGHNAEVPDQHSNRIRKERRECQRTLEARIAESARQVAHRSARPAQHRPGHHGPTAPLPEHVQQHGGTEAKTAEPAPRKSRRLGQRCEGRRRRGRRGEDPLGERCDDEGRRPRPRSLAELLGDEAEDALQLLECPGPPGLDMMLQKLGGRLTHGWSRSAIARTLCVRAVRACTVGNRQRGRRRC
mmetsp:Transcript_99710/g.321228  ORF Transcript_99710/g.321228 Transcript_99710/m.321228 type:complete len:212 (-) Transcript_99710:13-648(-)